MLRRGHRYGWVLALGCLVACGGSSQRAPDASTAKAFGGADSGAAGTTGAAGAPGGAGGAAGTPDPTDGGAAGAPDPTDDGAAGAPDPTDDGAAGAPDEDAAPVSPDAAGDSSEGGATGAGGASDASVDPTGAAGTTAGASGTAGGTGGTGGDGGTGAGSGSAGAAGGASGAAGTAAAAGTGGCVKALHGDYLVRTDNLALLELDDAAKTQRPVLDGATGLPLEQVTAIQEGYTHACALIGAAKTVSCWRTNATGNGYGQLGNGAKDTSGAVFRATQVLAAANRPLTGVKAIAQSYAPFYNSLHQVNTSCAVTEDGHLSCWGDLKYLTGNGVATSSGYATVVSSNGTTPLAGVLAVSVSTDFACALLQGAANREVWCWGANGTTEVLGQGDTDVRRYPAKVAGLTNPSKIVTADSTACAIDGGQVRCWGYNAQGEAGVGNLKTPVHAPTAVILMGSTTPIANISDLSAGNDASGGSTSFCALDETAHKLLCWGTAFHESASPYPIPAIVAVGAVDQDLATGQARVRALTSDGLYRVGTVTRQPNCGPPQ